MNEERFATLVESYLEGRLSEEEARELLEAPEPFRGRLLDEVVLAGLLARSEGGARADLSARVQAALRLGSEKEALVGRVLDGLPRRRPGPSWFLAAAAAAVLILGAAALWIRGAGSPAVPRLPAAAAATRPALAPEVRASVGRAVEFLHRAPLPSCAWNAPAPSDELVLLSFLSAGVSPRDPLFGRLLAAVLASRLQRTYSVSLQALVLERLDAALYRDRIADCAQFLVDNQCINGQWSYGTPTVASREGKVRRTRDGPLSGNNSCSQLAAVGLRACARAGIALPPEIFERAIRAWHECQRPEADGRAGWCYTRDESPHRPYGSMTAGGVASLAILHRLAGHDWRADRFASAGFAWMSYHFTVQENFGPVEELMAKEMISDTPNPNTELYYWLWAVERAATLCGAVSLDGRDWYAEGSRELLATQRPDGSWSSGVRRCQPVWDTCYAVLFLTRSTEPWGD